MRVFGGVKLLAFRVHIDLERHRAKYLVAFFAAGVAIVSGLLLTTAEVRSDNPSDDAVGTIEGDAIALQGPMSVEVVRGQIKTMLRSGNDIRVKSGQARLDLVEGGQIGICGPAHLSVLKSGGSLTVALDTGIIHAHLERKPALTIYTAQIQAKPIAIGDGPQDVLIGFENPGAMCARATAGAIRLEQQLTAQNVIVPQGGDVVVNNGQLEGLQNTQGHCSCEIELAKTKQQTPEFSRMATPEEIKQRDVEPKKAPPIEEKTEEAPRTPREEPVYQVFMPPLAYDAHAAVQKDNFDPKLILLVRRVRVRPTLIFQGRVEDAPVVAQNTAPKSAKPAPTTQAAPAASAQSDDSVVNRVRAFFHRLFS
jgi:hypothetical protein